MPCVTRGQDKGLAFSDRMLSRWITDMEKTEQLNIFKACAQ
jgi:hypothetical protein